MNYGRSEYRAENASVAIAGAGVEGTIMTIVIPPHVVMKLKEFGNYIDTVAAWGDIVWTFRLNGFPLAPYDRVLDQIGYAAQRAAIQELELSGGIFTITAQNNGIPAVIVGASLGWQFIYVE